MPSFIRPALLLGTALLAACTSNPDPAATKAAAAPAAPAATTTAPLPGPTSASAARLVRVATSDTIWNGVAVADDDRTFVLFPHNEGDPGTRLGELQPDGSVRPYPDRRWNSWRPGDPQAATKIVRGNSVRFGPDGLLWVVDTGTPKMGAAPIANGPKLLAFDIKTNELVKSLPLDKYVKPESFVDDLRFHGPFIYASDAGAPALIVVDQRTGAARRVLEDDTSATARRPLMGEGRPSVKPDGSLVRIHADQLEVSPDGRLLYYQPCSGPMYTLETKLLDDPAVAPATLARRVRYFCNTPTSGGTTMDADGTLYVCDANEKRILRITPAGQSSVLVQDPRLIWADALWLDHAGTLFIPVPQMNRTAGFNHGVDAVDYPVALYKMPLGVKPLRY